MGMETGRFPNKLRSFRRISGLSQKKVARRLGFSDTSTLSRWENGLATPSLVQVFRLARMYQTTPQALYEDLWTQSESEEYLLAQEDEPFSSNQILYV